MSAAESCVHSQGATDRVIWPVATLNSRAKCGGFSSQESIPLYLGSCRLSAAREGMSLLGALVRRSAMAGGNSMVIKCHLLSPQPSSS